MVHVNWHKLSLVYLRQALHTQMTGWLVFEWWLETCYIIAALILASVFSPMLLVWFRGCWHGLFTHMADSICFNYFSQITFISYWVDLIWDIALPAAFLIKHLDFARATHWSQSCQLSSDMDGWMHIGVAFWWQTASGRLIPHYFVQHCNLRLLCVDSRWGRIEDHIEGAQVFDQISRVALVLRVMVFTRECWGFVLHLEQITFEWCLRLDHLIGYFVPMCS